MDSSSRSFHTLDTGGRQDDGARGLAGAPGQRAVARAEGRRLRHRHPGRPAAGAVRGAAHPAPLSGASILLQNVTKTRKMRVVTCHSDSHHHVRSLVMLQSPDPTPFASRQRHRLDRIEMRLRQRRHRRHLPAITFNNAENPAAGAREFPAPERLEAETRKLRLTLRYVLSESLGVVGSSREVMLQFYLGLNSDKESFIELMVSRVCLDNSHNVSEHPWRTLKECHLRKCQQNWLQLRTKKVCGSIRGKRIIFCKTPNWTLYKTKYSTNFPSTKRKFTSTQLITVACKQRVFHQPASVRRWTCSPL